MALSNFVQFRNSVTFVAAFVAASACACDSDDPAGSASDTAGSAQDAADAATSTSPNGDVPVATSNPESVENPNAQCTTVVVIGLYGDDACAAGSEKMLIEMDLAHDCYGWTRNSDRGEVDNSATRIQCYRDRICYTQHTETLACDKGTPTDKETRTDTCTLEPQGGLWSRIVSGTEGCPEAPADFECPISGSFGGTPGVVAATACE